MKCFYCKTKLHPDNSTDICDKCLFYVDDNEQEYDEDLQREIESIVNPSGVTPARYID